MFDKDEGDKDEDSICTIFNDDEDDEEWSDSTFQSRSTQYSDIKYIRGWHSGHYIGDMQIAKRIHVLYEEFEATVVRELSRDYKLPKVLIYIITEFSRNTNSEECVRCMNYFQHNERKIIIKLCNCSYCLYCSYRSLLEGKCEYCCDLPQ